MEDAIKEIKWDVIGVCEIRHRGENLKTLKSGHLFYSIGSETESVGGVGFFIHKKHKKNVVDIKSVSTRVAYVTLKLNNRYKLKIIQVYAPTTQHPDEEVEDFYDDISVALKDTPTHFTILCGDFNAKLGLKEDEAETSLGNFGTLGRNERGETLLGFLLQNNLFQMNSFFVKKLHRRWTWESPDGKTRNEIDYIISDKKQIITDVSVLNKFTTGSDHRMVRATIKIDLKKETKSFDKKENLASLDSPIKY